MHKFVVFLLGHLGSLHFLLIKNLEIRSGLSNAVSTVADFILVLSDRILQRVRNLAH